MSDIASETPPLRRVRTLSQALVVTGIVIAVANMLLAWVIMFTRPSEMPAEAPQAAASAARAPADAAGSSSYAAPLANPYTELFRPQIRSAAMKEMADTNVRTLTVAFAFALMAIGFSLFVMGIEGALSFHGELGEIGRLVLKTASPGILCIVLSAGMLGLLLVLTQTTFGDTREAARADTMRAESEAKVRLVEAEAEARRTQNLDSEMERTKRESDEWKSRYELQQRELEQLQGQLARPAPARK